MHIGQGKQLQSSWQMEIGMISLEDFSTIR